MSNTGITFLDGLIEDILERKELDHKTIESIIEFMKNQQYDSDALKEDLMENASASNLLDICDGNVKIIVSITQLMAIIKCIQTILSVSFCS